MVSCNPLQFIVWLLVLIFLSFFVAFFCGPLYAIVHCLAAFIAPLSDGSGELIFYERPDTTGPKLSDYKKANLNPEGCQGISVVLAESNGILGNVEKTRYLYMVGQSRVHVDRVVDLGTFAEIEVVLRDDQTIEMGQKISEDLMEKLGITTDDLISKAYLDLLIAKAESTST